MPLKEINLMDQRLEFEHRVYRKPEVWGWRKDTWQSLLSLYWETVPMIGLIS